MMFRYEIHTTPSGAISFKLISMPDKWNGLSSFRGMGEVMMRLDVVRVSFQVNWRSRKSITLAENLCLRPHTLFLPYNFTMPKRTYLYTYYEPQDVFIREWQEALTFFKEKLDNPVVDSFFVIPGETNA